MQGRNPEHGSGRRPVVRQEARKIGDTFVVDQPNGQQRLATSPEIFQTLEVLCKQEDPKNLQVIDKLFKLFL